MASRAASRACSLRITSNGTASSPRTRSSSSTGTTTYTYNNADELTAAGATNYSYDNNGNETAGGNRTFTYDLADRIATTTANSVTSGYSYDGDGNRLQASTGTAPSQTTNFLWDTSEPLPQIALERDGNQTLTRRYTYGVRRLAMTTGGSDHYYQYDVLGSVSNVTTSTGGVEWTYAYEPFGPLRQATQNDPNAPANSVDFVGEMRDPTGLIYLRARQLDPVIGRLITVDPVEADVGVASRSAYAYAGSQPTVMVDPSGKTYVPADDGVSTASFAASPHTDGVAPCGVVFIRICATDGDAVEGGGKGTGVIVGTGAIATIAAAALKRCMERYDESHCTLMRWGINRHHIVARRAAAAKEAQDILRMPWNDSAPRVGGIGLPRGTENDNNIVELPRYSHMFLHTGAYYKTVNELISFAFRGGKSGHTASTNRVVGMLVNIGDTLQFILGAGLAA